MIKERGRKSGEEAVVNKRVSGQKKKEKVGIHSSNEEEKSIYHQSLNTTLVYFSQ